MRAVGLITEGGEGNVGLYVHWTLELLVQDENRTVFMGDGCSGVLGIWHLGGGCCLEFQKRLAIWRYNRRSGWGSYLWRHEVGANKGDV
jgi:hypothetical protein